MAYIPPDQQQLVVLRPPGQDGDDGAQGHSGLPGQDLGQSVAANSSFHWYGNKKLVSTDFVVGGSNTTTALVIQLEYEQNVV